MSAKREPDFAEPTGVDRTQSSVSSEEHVPFAEGAASTETAPPGRKEGDAVGVLLGDVPMKRVDWLWNSHIALGKMTLIDGNPGVGKSTLTLDVVARVTAGSKMPDGASSCLDGPRGVVLLSAEDGAGDTIRPRLQGMGGDPSKVLLLTGVVTKDGERMPNIGDLNAIKQAVERVDAALIVIDPLFAYTGKNDAHRDSEMRSALAPLIIMCEAMGVALLVLRHLNKNANGGAAMYRGGGTIGIIGAARCAFIASRDPEEEKKYVFAPNKINLCDHPSALAYHLEGVSIGISGDVGVVATSRVVWDGTVDISADALVAPTEVRESSSQLEDAKSFLIEELRGGPMLTSTVDTHAKQQGYSPRTLKRARKALGIVAYREDAAAQSPWMLRLADAPMRPGVTPPTPPVSPAGAGGQGVEGQPPPGPPGPVVNVSEDQGLGAHLQ
jgi:hypothetical protein